MTLPNETVVRRAIRQQLANELSQCREMLEFGLGLPDPDVVNRRRLSADTVSALMGLFTKTCVSYRAIIYLCENGLDRSAAPVSRSLFETFLNLTFLARRRVVLHHFDFSNGTKTPFDLCGKTLDTEFRTDLYCAFCLLKDEKMVGQWAKTPKLKRAGKGAYRRLSGLPQPHVAALGPIWKKRLKRANTCVGLSIADYAASLGSAFYTLYRSVYAMDSQSVHQSDSLAYLEVDDKAENISPRWHTSPSEVRFMLHQSSMMFLGCNEELNKRLRFGENIKNGIADCAAKLKNWKL